MTPSELREEVIRIAFVPGNGREARVSNEVLEAAGLGRIFSVRDTNGVFVGASTKPDVLRAWLASFKYRHLYSYLDYKLGSLLIKLP